MFPVKEMAVMAATALKAALPEQQFITLEVVVVRETKSQESVVWAAAVVAPTWQVSMAATEQMVWAVAAAALGAAVPQAATAATAS
jgi:hypothetical protein